MIARINPGIAAAKNGARQLPKASTIGPTVKNARTSPTGRPNIKTPIALERFSALYKSPIIDVAVGAQLASPIPNPILTKSKLA